LPIALLLLVALIGVHVSTILVLAQSIPGVRDQRFCADLRRLLQSAGDGFRPFVIRRIPGSSILQGGATFDPLPLSGFESAVIWLASARPSAAATYQARSMSLAISPINPVDLWISEVATCLDRQPAVHEPFKGARFTTSDSEIEVLHTDDPPRFLLGGPRITLTIRHPPACKGDVTDLASC
jgi:hypothetical protein